MSVTLMDDDFAGAASAAVAGRTVDVLTWLNIAGITGSTLDGSGNAVGEYGTGTGNEVAFDSNIMSEEISLGVRLSSILYSNGAVVTLSFGTSAAGEVLVIDGRTDGTCRLALNGATRASGLSLVGVLVELVVNPVLLTVDIRVGGSSVHSEASTRTLSPVSQLYIAPHFGGGVGGTIPKVGQFLVVGAEPPDPPLPADFWTNFVNTREVA